MLVSCKPSPNDDVVPAVVSTDKEAKVEPAAVSSVNEPEPVLKTSESQADKEEAAYVFALW